MPRPNPTLVALLLLLPAGLWAQDAETTEQRLRALEEQNLRILERLESSEQRNRVLEAELDHVRRESDVVRQDALLEERINALSARFPEPGVVSSRSGNPVQIYGFVRSDAYVNTARANHAIATMWVLPENGTTPGPNNSTFVFDVRLTRIGFDIDAGKIGAADTTGKIELDFLNFPSGLPESRQTPRIRLAYINLDFGDITLRLGQDWDTISPLYPAVNLQATMWNAGNLGDRRPQASLIWDGGDPHATAFQLRLTAGLTGAVDNQDLDTGFGTERDGFDAGFPHGQIRLGITTDSWVEAKRVSAGVWGMVAGLETDLPVGISGRRHFTPWVIGVDWTVPLFGPVEVRGELWFGQALSDWRGNIGQAINVLSGEEIRGWGGWAELRIQASEALRLSLGGTLDNPRNRDLTTNMVGPLPIALARSRNWTLYANGQYDFGGGLLMGLDAIYWQTEWKGVGQGNMLRFDVYAILKF